MMWEIMPLTTVVMMLLTNVTAVAVLVVLVLKGSWDLVTTVIIRVTILITPIKVLITLLTKSHDPPSSHSGCLHFHDPVKARHCFTGPRRVCGYIWEFQNAQTTTGEPQAVGSLSNPTP